MKLVGLLTLLLTLFAQSSFAQTANGTSTASNIVYLSAEENQFYQLINQFRTQLGLPTLQIHVDLQNAAVKHSAWMASQDFLTHYGPAADETPFQRMVDEGYANYTYLGENVACGNGDAIKTFRQWAFSPGHLANMVNPHYRHMGISRAGTGNERCPYFWTNDFGSMSDLSADQPTPTDLQKISAAIALVSGSIPAGQSVQLPTPDPAPASTPTPQENDFSLIQCMIPYATGKDILSFIPNTDAILEISKNSLGNYQGTVSYIQNGAAANLQPFTINTISVVKNSNYPLYLIFSAPIYRGTGGFTIQLDTTKESAQFDVYPSNGSSSAVMCTLKY